MQAGVPRHESYWLVTMLKAVGAQCIVLHHLAFYGPMADHVREWLPALIDWLDDHARVAVQIFLVVGGFLAARSLHSSCSVRDGGSSLRRAHPGRLILQRYAKLAPPFWIAMLLAVAASAWAGRWMAHHSLSAMPDAVQWTAHMLLLHGVLGQESLSAGAWYVAIDLQLYALSACMMWLAFRVGAAHAWAWLVPAMTLAGIGASVMLFNRHPDWDDWAPYFFGSYGLGILAWWASEPDRRPGAVLLVLSCAGVLVAGGLFLEFRVRLVVASLVGAALALGGRAMFQTHGVPGKSLNHLARTSYAVFLVHFPVCLVINAAFIRYVPQEPLWQALGMLTAWAASIAAGAAFHRWIEVPAGRLGQWLARFPGKACGGRAVS